MRTRLLPALLVLALAGCGAEKSTGSGSGGGIAGQPSASSGGDTVRVEIKDILFVPERRARSATYAPSTPTRRAPSASRRS